MGGGSGVDHEGWAEGDPGGRDCVLEGAIAWLRGRSALLPGITTLERLVAEGRRAADVRAWAALAGPLDPVLAEKLIGLLDVPDGSGRADRRREQRVSELERLRKGVFRSSSKGMVAALHRLADVQAAGVAGLDVGAVPPRRLVALATYGMAAKATLLRRLPREHKPRSWSRRWSSCRPGPPTTCWSCSTP